MNDIKALSIYFNSELSSLLDMPVYNDLQDNIKADTYCVFYILSGEPITFVDNQLAFNSFDVRITIWSKQWQFDKIQSVIDYFNSKQGLIVSDEAGSFGLINSIVYEGQESLRDNNDLSWYGLQAIFRLHTRPNLV